MHLLRKFSILCLLYHGIDGRRVNGTINPDEINPENGDCDEDWFIYSQDDVDALRAKCKKVARMRIQRSFGGDLNLDGFESLGHIAPESCLGVRNGETVLLDGCNITNIFSSTLTNVGNIFISHQIELRSISLPEVKTLGKSSPGDLSLSNLTALESVDLSSLEYGHTLKLQTLPKLSTLKLAATGWPSLPIVYPSETFNAYVTVSNTSLTTLDYIFQSDSGIIRELSVSDNPKLDSLTITAPATAATISGNRKLSLVYNLSSSDRPWIDSMAVAGLAEFKTSGIANITSFAAYSNEFKRLDIEFYTRSLSVSANANLANLYLHKPINGTVKIGGKMLNLTFPTGADAKLEQDVGYFAWPNATTKLEDIDLSGWISNKIFAGLTDADLSAVPIIDKMSVDTQNPDFNCTVLERLKEAGKVRKLKCDNTTGTSVYGEQSEENLARSFRHSFSAIWIALLCMFVMVL